MGPRLLGNSQGLKVHGASPGVSNFALKITLTTKAVLVVAHNQERIFSSRTGTGQQVALKGIHGKPRLPEAESSELSGVKYRRRQRAELREQRQLGPWGPEPLPPPGQLGS